MVAVGVADVRPIVDRVCARPDVLEACRKRDLGSVIKTLWKNGFTQGKIGVLTGKPQGRISEWVTGKRAPQHATVIDEIATGLGFPPAARRALGLTAEPPATAITGSPSDSPQLDTGQALVQYLATDGERLLQGRFTEEVGRELHSAVADATRLAAWMTYDSTPSSGLAQRYFVQALALAKAADDKPLGGDILDAMSQPRDEARA
jgi:transcriptional regulator with XRE-family HTH domain